MAPRFEQVEQILSRLDSVLGQMMPSASAAMRPAIERWRSDAAALRFHARPRDPEAPLLVAVIGGTGTGKSTLVNRLIGAEAMAANFRRTFTAGSVALADDARVIPSGWLGVESTVLGPEQLPARGQGQTLLVVPRSALPNDLPQASLLRRVVLIDTPDLDGDQPLHHAEAERAFRWAQGLIFAVTPEKYQMTELLPYYRMSARYAIPTLFVMNKCEESAVVEDYRGQLRQAGFVARRPDRSDAGGRADGPPVYTIPRDDAAFEPPASENLSALRQAVERLGVQTSSLQGGLAHRIQDLAGRLEDQIVNPLREERWEADRLVDALRDMETPAPGVDVNPVTQDLERRLQQRSVLYLIGPQRMLDRVRQAPTMLVRLPRVAWDYLMKGQTSRLGGSSLEVGKDQVPDFKAALTDQFSVLQSRIDDLLRASSQAQKWMAASPQSYAAARVAPETAGSIAEQELAELRTWLEKRWNATPRDTRVMQSLLKFLPGGAKMTHLTEAAPYLLAIGLIAHHALFGTELIVIGGYTLATWLTERLSNEVASRTRATNAKIAERFTELAHEQIQKMCLWISQQASAQRTLEQLEKLSGELSKASPEQGR